MVLTLNKRSDQQELGGELLPVSIPQFLMDTATASLMWALGTRTSRFHVSMATSPTTPSLQPNGVS